ncbi:MAG TPA: sugar ABC transporter permease [Mycobacteriales bacterium]|jgi:multiple sugar transport system permease protein|nr:sugar ABC transporter permease [Mycobacteriales bacterium]
MAVTTVPLATTPAATAGHTRRHRRQDSRAGWGLMSPFLVLYVLFLIGPLVYGVIMSFSNASLVQSGLGGSAGFSNYSEALHSHDFWSSMWHTVLFTIMTTPPLVVLALVFAMLAERLRRGRWFWRLVFFAPYVVPSAAVALIFGWLYAAQGGLFGAWLSDLGIDSPNWLGDANWAMASIALMTIWWTIGFNFVLYLAGLADIPRELYEAAAVDGATPWVQMRRITIPLLKRTTMLITMLQVLASLKVFDQMYLLTAGGPNFSTRPVIQYIYDMGFTDYRAGYSAAASMLYFIGLVLVSAIWFAINRRQTREG